MTRLTFPAIDTAALDAEIAACDTFTEITALIDSLATHLAARAADDAGIPRAQAIEPAIHHVTTALTA